MKSSPGFGGERSRRKEGRELMERERREEREKKSDWFFPGIFSPFWETVVRVNRRKKGCFYGKKGCCCCTVIRRRLRGGKRKKEIGINSFPPKRKKKPKAEKRSPLFISPLDNNLVISGSGAVGSQGKKVFPSFPSFWHVPPYHITRKKAEEEGAFYQPCQEGGRY